MLKRISIKDGFTLIELMVAVSIFAIVAVIATGALLVANRINHKAQTTKLVVDNLNFALDSMTLKMRNGGYFYCLTGNTDDPDLFLFGYDRGNNCTYQSGGGEAITFISGDKRYVYRRFETAGRGEIQVSKQEAGGMSDYVTITAAAIDVRGIKFFVDGYQQGRLPKVLISLVADGRVGPEVTAIALETAVAARSPASVGQ